MPGPDCRKSPEPAVFADDQFYLRRMKEILQQTPGVGDASSVEGSGGLCTPSYGPQLQPVQLLEHVFIGSQRNADNLDVLRRHGITHVLNCAGLRRYDFTRSPYPKDTGIRGFLMFSAEDNEDYDIKRHFPEAIAFLDDVKRSRGRSLVHCNLGVNRSGAVVAAYLMVSERRTLLDVIQYLRSKRSLVLSNKGFRRQLVTFARERRLLDPIISDDEQSGSVMEARVNSHSSSTSQHNSGRTVNPSSRVTPSVVVSDVTDLHQSTPDADAESSNQNGRRYWSTRQASWLLSPVYEQPAETSSSSGGVLGGFLTLFGAGAGRRRPLRSTSFSNVSSCTAGNAATSTTAATAVTASGTAGGFSGSTLSTARPLRVYTRSSTDTELYRRGRPRSTRPPASHLVVGRQRFSEEHGRPVE